jgi:hypothetical protein
VPLESAEPIAVKSSNLNRDYSINLLPEEDPQMIVWELQRPIQQTLPPLSDAWEQEFHRCWRTNERHQQLYPCSPHCKTVLCQCPFVCFEEGLQPRQQ